MPVTESEDKILYYIYHNDIDLFSHFKEISGHNVYEYHNINREEFADSTGVFYTDVSLSEVRKIGQEVGILIDENIENSYTTYSSLLIQIMFNIVVLMITTEIVIFIYILMKSKKCCKKINGIFSKRYCCRLD